MRNIFERQQSFGNVTPFNKADAAELFMQAASVAATTLGPNAYKVLIQTFGSYDVETGNLDGSMTDNTYSTKDGHDTLRSIRFNNKYKQAIYNGSLETCRINDETSGDGTTSGYVFFANLFHSLYNNVYKDFVETKKLTNSQLVSVLRRCVDLYAQLVAKRHGVIVRDYEKLINIAKISLDNDENLLTPLRNLLETLAKNKIEPSTVSISIEKSADAYTSFEVSTSFEIKGNAYLKEVGATKIDNVRLILVNKPLDNDDIKNGLQKMLKVTKVHFEQTGEKVLVIVPGVNHMYVERLEATYRKLEITDEYTDRHLMIVPFSASLMGVPYDQYLDDLMIYFGMKTFTDITTIGINNLGDEIVKDLTEAYQVRITDVEYRDGLAEDERKHLIDEIVKERDTKINEIIKLDDLSFMYNFVLGKLQFAPLASIDVEKDYTVQVYNIKQEEDNVALRERAQQIAAAAAKTADIKEKSILNRRMRNIVGKYSILYVGATTENQTQSIMSQYKDATLAVNSAAKTGVVSGMNIPTLAVSNYIKHKLSLDGFEDPAKMEILSRLKPIEFLDTKDDINLNVIYGVISSIERAAYEIFYHILSNADINEEGIEHVYETLVKDGSENYDVITPELKAFNVLSKEFTDNVISPIESEVGYIKAGISTCLEYLPARLFIHQNEWSINNELK